MEKSRIKLIKRNNPKEILSLIRHEKRLKILTNKLMKYHEHDISEAMKLMNEEERHSLYNHLSLIKKALVFEQLDEKIAAEFIFELDKTEAARVLEQMEPDDAIDILQELNEDDALSFTVLMDDDRREYLHKLARYHHSTAGSEMNSYYITFTPEMGVKEAMKKLVNYANEVEMIDTLFVIDDQNHLIGVLDLKDLIVAKHPTKIKDIMQEKFYYVNVEDDIQEVVKDIQKYDTLAMPVVDDHQQLQGIITMYDALDIIEEEASDDYAKLAAVSSEYDMGESAFKSARKRFPWLALLLILNIIVSSVLASYEETIAAITALVLFQPLILGMAGNIGTQSLAVTVLGISRETLRSKMNITKHLTKEILVGLTNGIILGGLAYFTAYLFLTLAPIGAVQDGIIQPSQIALVVALSVMSALTISAFLGSVIPILLNAIKIDPAIASGPFITTINDVTALVVYFTLATVLIINLI